MNHRTLPRTTNLEGAPPGGPLAAARRWTGLLAALLAGCLPSRAAVFEPVERAVEARVGAPLAWGGGDRSRAAVDALLARPLDVEAAIRVAFARNRHLQVRLDELGLAASEVAGAGALPPLEVEVSYQRGHGGGELELHAVQDVVDVLLRWQRQGIANAELRAARARAVAAAVELAAEVEVAWWAAVAAGEEQVLVTTAFAAAAAAAELVERQHAAGSATDLQLARETEQRERARIEVARAAARVEEQRAALAARLGLDAGDPTWRVAERLPDPPTQPPDLDGLERDALAASLALDALRADADAAAGRRRHATVRAIVPVIGVGLAAARPTGGGWALGPALRIAVPWLGVDPAPRARARAEERRARDALAAETAALRGEVAIARTRAMTSYVEVRQLADVVLPLRQRVLDETVLHYNAMNASPYEVLAARRELVDAGRDYLEARRAYGAAIATTRALARGGRLGAEVAP